MVADYMPHNVGKRTNFDYGSERNQAYKAKRAKPVTKATGWKGDFGPRNPDGSNYKVPARKSKSVRPS
jgi:hypothetical protein